MTITRPTFAGGPHEPLPGNPAQLEGSYLKAHDEAGASVVGVRSASGYVWALTAAFQAVQAAFGAILVEKRWALCVC